MFKRILPLLLCGLLLWGCASDPEVTQPTPPAAPATTAPAEPVVEITEPAAEVRFGEFGRAITYDGSSYYFSHETDTLLCRTPDGAETAVLEYLSPRPFAIAGSMLFYSNEGTLCSVSLTDGQAGSWGEGSILAAAPDGSYLICTNDSVLYRFDTGSSEWTLLCADAGFLALHKDVVYYSPVLNTYGEEEQRGRVTLCAVNADGTQERTLCVTEPDLYDFYSGYSPASVAAIHFDEEALYFSYGSIAGTGLFYQGGKVIRIPFDGGESRVAAGQDSLVDGEFCVNGDGTVTASRETYYVDYAGNLSFLVRGNCLYWLDPVSGAGTMIADEAQLSGSAMTCDYWEVDMCTVSGGYAYYRVVYKVVDEENSFGWRTAYKTIGSALFRKDLTTGAAETLTN